MGAMNKKLAVVVGAVVTGAAALVIVLTRPSEEERIKKVLERLAAAVAIKEGDTVISRAGRMKSELKDVVDDQVSVDVEELGIHDTGRASLIEDAMKAGLVYQSASAELKSITIKLNEGASVAQVDLTAVVTATQGGAKKVEPRPVHFVLSKDGAWRVTAIDVHPPEDR